MTNAGAGNGGAPGGGGNPANPQGGTPNGGSPPASNGGSPIGSGGAAAGGSTQTTGGQGGGSAGGSMGGSSGAPGGGAGGGDPGPVVTMVDLPDNKPGIGFDDLRYSPDLKKLIVPAGRTGTVDLIDPQTLEITAISGFTATTMFTLGKHRNGSTSADYGAGKIFAMDNDTKTIKVVDPTTKMITSSTMLAGAPDYVRWVESTQEVWVSMPQNPGVSVPTPEIDVLKLGQDGKLTHSLNITFQAPGPESLYIDNKRHQAYTNNGFGGKTYAVDLMTHMVTSTWNNGCSALTVNLWLDDARNFLMVTCASGRVAVLDVANGGKQVGEITMNIGAGLDVIAYNETLHHMYVAGQDSKDMTIIGIPANGMPTMLGKQATVAGAQMCASDEYGNVWVVDPGGGRLIKIRDTYPATP
jgi:hypothetical protein